jgi:phosphoribosylformylglycinamidine synthase
MKLDTTITTVPAREMSFDQLRKFRKKGGYAFLDEDLSAVKEYYLNEGRDPTDLELRVLDQNWCEHSAHGTILGEITLHDYSENESSPKVTTFNNMLRDTIMANALKVNAPHIQVFFSDDSGLIDVCKIVDGKKVMFEIDGNGEKQTFMYAKKGESHNHPFAIEPVGAVETCIGGVLRDTWAVLGKPTSSMIFFCLGDPDIPDVIVPEGRKSPREYLLGGTKGHRRYGNPVGVATHFAQYYFTPKEIYTGMKFNGRKIHFDNVARPLVMGYSFGIVNKQNYNYRPEPGDAVITLGPPAKLVGIEGAVGSSQAHDQETVKTRESSVQQGNPEAERQWGKCLEDVLFDSGKIKYIQDFGGGGASSALFETPKRLNTPKKGIIVYANRIPTQVDRMTYHELFLNESQERMLIVVSQEDVPWIISQCARYEVEAVHVADLTSDGRFVVIDENTGKTVMDIEGDFVRNGKPKVRRTAVYRIHELPEPEIDKELNLNAELERLLRNPNLANQSPMIRSFDNEVQGRTILPQFSGPNFDNPNDATIVSLFDGYTIGAVEACVLNNRIGIKDMKKMVPYVIDQSIKRNILHGGNLETIVISDNWCMANTKSDDEDLGRLVVGCDVFGKKEIEYNAAANDGKDSMNNSFTDKNGEIHYIAPHLFVASLSITPDYRTAVSSFLKKPGNVIYIVGETTDEMGGSIFYYDLGYVGNRVPETNSGKLLERYRQLQKIIQVGIKPEERIVRAVKSVDDGGLAVAAFNMTYFNPATHGYAGLELDLSGLPTKGQIQDWHALFNEAPGRVLFEVPPEKVSQFEKMISGQPYARIGRVTNQDRIVIYGQNGELVLSDSVTHLKSVWGEKFGWV